MLNRLSLNRIGLNRIGLNRIGKPSGGSSDRPYIDPKVLDSLCGVWIMDQNTNESESRNIIKNTIKNKGGDLELLNFGYKLNSGYNGYATDFTEWHGTYSNKTQTKITVSIDIYFPISIISFKNVTSAPSFRIKVSGLPKGQNLYYKYINEEGLLEEKFNIPSDGIYTLPATAVSDTPTTVATLANEQYNINIKGLTIEQLPLYEGALVTDGKDDMITSTKTVQEMLGGSNEITVVSMVHQIGLSSLTTINNIRSESVAHVVCRNICSSAGKTGIYGYSKQINTNNPPTLINNILGDKKDYTAEGKSALVPIDKFFVQGYKYSGTISEVSPIAYYWTFIANKVLTTDQINQVIAYYNLDKYVKPDIYYDVKKQSLSNDTPDADWYLKDFSGNGRDMQLYNYGKTPESGINEEGGLQSDGVTDFGKVENLPIYKDYTVVADREIVDGLIDNANGGVATRSYNYAKGAFGFDWKNQAFSFGGNTDRIIDVQRFISYQSKYVNNGIQLITGNVVDNNPLYMARLGEENRYSKLALWSFLLFPYTLSEFLLERQLKRYKLGTLYPDMIEWRPKVNINVPVVTPPTFSMNNGSDIITNGQYIPEGTEIIIRIFTATDSSVEGINEATAKINGVDIELSPSGNKTYYGGKFIVSSKQKIDITIDEYIRYEDIVQPYPAIINLKQDGKTITWGDKLKVGSDIVFAGSANLLPELYTVSETRYNGVTLYPNTIIKVEKSMVFDNARTYLKANEPNCILSPNRLRIPNSSYKTLGYIPDLTGKGNHGKLNNFAYTEDSGVAADGSIKFDGTDDHITIPTLAHGGKCVMMKVNWSNGGMLYDQRLNSSAYAFGILTSEALPAYNARNNGSTYIDGILNTSIIPIDLSNITHNITAVNDAATDNSTVSPRLGVSVTNATFSNMSLYEFMLFPEIPSEDEIKKLNDVMGIEGGYVESPNYYWDAYGKKNTDTDRNLIADQVSKDVDNALEVKNVAYNSESGYGYGKSNFISIMESSQQFVDIIDDYNFIIKATPHNNNQFFAQVNTPKLIPNNYIRFKVSGIPEDFKMVFGYDYVEGGANEYSHIIDKNGVYSYDSFNVFYTSFRAYTGYTDLTGLNIKVEFLDYHPNGLLLDGVEDYLINTVIPAVTDFTVIAKRISQASTNDTMFITKGQDGVVANSALGLEYRNINGEYVYSFGTSTNVESIPDLITYCTPTNYNGKVLTRGNVQDTNGIQIGKFDIKYWKGVFYKLMFYTKTIDQLSINMLKNLFERDELIDVTNPIFKKQ